MDVCHHVSVAGRFEKDDSDHHIPSAMQEPPCLE